MEDKFTTKFESGGLKYTCNITSRLCGSETFFLVSFMSNEKHSLIRSFEIELRDEENEIPVWSVRNKNKYSEEIIPDELVYIIGQKINYYYDLMQYGSYSRQ